MPLLVISKIRYKLKALCSRQHLPTCKWIGFLFHFSRASYSKENRPILPKFELSRDGIPVLIICKLDEDPIKNEDAIDRTTFSPL